MFIQDAALECIKNDIEESIERVSSFGLITFIFYVGHISRLQRVYERDIP